MLACLQQRSLEGNSQNKTLGFIVLGFSPQFKNVYLTHIQVSSKLNFIIFGDFSIQILTQTYMEILCVLHLNYAVKTILLYYLKQIIQIDIFQLIAVLLHSMCFFRNKVQQIHFQFIFCSPFVWPQRPLNHQSSKISSFQSCKSVFINIFPSKRNMRSVGFVCQYTKGAG